MAMSGQDTLNTKRTLTAGGKTYSYFSLKAAEEAGLGDISSLPYSMKVVLENLLRFEDGNTVTVEDIRRFASWVETRHVDGEIAYRPARVLAQDYTGGAMLVDLAVMREAMKKLGGDPHKINPLVPVDFVIDHSIRVQYAGDAEAFDKNIEIEYRQNRERYELMKWSQQAFDNFRLVPPGSGICHQVNLENLASVVWSAEENGETLAFPDTVVGLDSHTTMINGVSVLGWGVGGIEAEAAMLGQPVSMLIPDVVGFRMTGELPEGATATDLVLTVTQMLRKKGVVGRFVEYFGPGAASLKLADRATIGNMSPEYGATCGIFPIDSETLNYLRLTGRPDETVALVEAYAKEQGMWRDDTTPDPVFTDILELDLSTVEPSMAGPRRPNERVGLQDVKTSFAVALKDMGGRESRKSVAVPNSNFEIEDGAVVLAAITSCTNTSNPSVLIGAGLVAKKAVELGLTVKPWVKTSLAPGSQVVEDYLKKSGLQAYLDQLGFNIAAFGCTTCVGNSGPLKDNVQEAVENSDLVVSAVLSGNRNFEGRVHPLTRSNYLASPPLVVAYALFGTTAGDIATEPLGTGKDGQPIYLKDVWPSNREIHELIESSVTPEMFRNRYAKVFDGTAEWRKLKIEPSEIYRWSDASTYVQKAPYFDDMPVEPSPLQDIKGARILALLGDNITTDHISPVGSIKADSPAGEFLQERQVPQSEFNAFGARRGNHLIMTRGTFGNIRIRNEIVRGTEGGYTRHYPSGEEMSIYHAAMKYIDEGVPTVVVGGKAYGQGSSRDWAAKGSALLGIKAVLVEDFERIHRSNLVGMGVLPLEFKPGDNRETLGLKGDETFDIEGIASGFAPGQDMKVTVHYADGSRKEIAVTCRIDTAIEVEYFKHGGILHYVLRQLAKAA